MSLKIILIISALIIHSPLFTMEKRGPESENSQNQQKKARTQRTNSTNYDNIETIKSEPTETDSILIAQSTGPINSISSSLQRLPAAQNAQGDRNPPTAEQQLIDAAEKGDQHTFFRLLVSCPGINLNARNQQGNTALMIAARKGHIIIVQQLLAQQNIDVNVHQDGRTALHGAVANGHRDIVQCLLMKDGIDINMRYKAGDLTPLLFACQRDDNEIICLLLDHPTININVPDLKGTTALMIAAARGNREIVQRLLVKPEIQINIQNGHGITALMCAVYYGHKEVAQLLLGQQGININAVSNTGDTALVIAIQKSNKEITKLLLDNPGTDFQLANQSNGMTPLMIAAKEGHAEIIGLLLVKHNISINVQDKDGWTALMLAAFHGHPVAVRSLLVPGIDVNIQNKWGDTALTGMATHSDVPTTMHATQLLIAAGADLDYVGRKASKQTKSTRDLKTSARQRSLEQHSSRNVQFTGTTTRRCVWTTR